MFNIQNDKINRLIEIFNFYQYIINHPIGFLTKRFANYKVTEVGFNSSSLSCRYTEKGSKLTLAPRSSNASFIMKSPIVQEIVWQPGSLYFGGTLYWMIVITCSIKNAVFFTCVRCRVDHLFFLGVVCVLKPF